MKYHSALKLLKKVFDIRMSLKDIKRRLSSYCDDREIVIAAYYRFFDTTDGNIILLDLMKLCDGDKMSSFCVNDELNTILIREGKQAVFKYILEKIAMYKNINGIIK